ncbi:MAG: hypothetical protein HQK89_02325 [Nitrospirae bacterium]|nr:hypothetical protein [Nitrospirota bacterium]
MKVKSNKAELQRHLADGSSSVTDDVQKEDSRIVDGQAGVDGKRIDFSSDKGKGLRETKVPVSDETFDFVGVKPGNLYADYGALYKKHPDQFKSPKEVKRHIEYVLDRPGFKLPESDPNYTLLVRRNGGDRAAIIEFQLKGGKYRVVSAYTLDEGQLERKIEALNAVPKPFHGSTSGSGEYHGGDAPSTNALHSEPSVYSIDQPDADVNKKGFAIRYRVQARSRIMQLPRPQGRLL